ncbi:MAG: Cytochrome c oxidase assembly protein CtaG [Pseudomonadales bacterium]|nr:Cytochrome c oxidase assembly protein CtaG [Pseudomonadales bacterium]
MRAPDPNRPTVLWTCAAAVAMFGFGFALVPLYDVLCDVMGIGRDTITAPVDRSGGEIDAARTVRVQFVATNDGTMPWEFRPERFELRVHPGASNGTRFHVRNPAPRTMTAQAIPSVSPAEAAPYFHKTECFCFGQQTLGSGESLDMPLQFIVDAALPEKISTITLSYTLFDVTARVAAR